MNSETYHYFFMKLANPLKISIITSLKKREKTVSGLVEDLGVEQSKISHALSNLRDCHIVEYRQEGKKRIYHLNKKTIIPILRLIDEHAKSFCKGNCIAKKQGACRGCGK